MMNMAPGMILNTMPTLLAVLAMVAVVSIILQFFIGRCPKCKQAMGFTDAGSERMWKCDHCGFSEVEKIQPPAPAPVGLGPWWKSPNFWGVVIGIIVLTIVVLVSVVPVLNGLDESGFNVSTMTL